MVPGAPELAAVLACGPRAFISHHSAAALWGLAERVRDEVEVTSVGRHCRSRPGVHVYRAGKLDARDWPQWTQSEGERRMLRLIRHAQLPAPRTQVRVGGWPADFLWPEHRLIVEVDGYRFHGHRRAFERDRRRDAAHVAAGYVVIRVTWRQLREEPFSVVATIARALGR
jgi:very-short-patch-repair endonuclease